MNDNERFEGRKPVNRNKKGIVIITTMLLLSIVIMIAALLVVTGRSTLLLGASYSDREQAYYAAECGLAYAQHCISKYKDWVAGETTLDSLYDPGFTDFTVSTAGTQSNCVRGVLHGNGSEFYITFYSGTWNDASSPRKDIDHKGNLGTPLKYYSVNNLSNDSDGYSKYLDDEGKGKTFRDVPKNSAHIIVEGRCNQVRRYAEAILQKLDVKTGSACSIAAGGVEVDLMDNNSVFMVDAEGSNESKIRSMGDIKVTSSANDKNCYQISNTGSSCTGAGTEASPTSKYTYVNNAKIDTKTEQTDYGITCENKPQGEYLEKAKLKWDDVTKKYLSGSTYDASTVKTTIKAGTYVYMNSEAYPDTYNLYYYPPSVTYDPDADKNADSNPKNFVNENSTPDAYSTALVASSRSGDLTILETVTKAQLAAGKTYLFSAANPIGIEPVENEGSFALAVYDYKKSGNKDTWAPSTTYRASVKLEGTDEQDPCLISKSEGNIYVAGELSGKGKILSGGELAFQGKSMLEADATSSDGVSIYAQGSVNIDPVKGAGNASDPNDDIKEAWNNVTSKLDASGSYYDSKLTDYKDLQKLLLETKVTDAAGNATKLGDVLKNDYKYDKAAIEAMINTIMSKNTYIGSDTSSSTETSDVTSGSSSTFTYSGNTYTAVAYTDMGVPHMAIYNNGDSVLNTKTDSVIRLHYYGGKAEVDGVCGSTDLATLSGSTVASNLISYSNTGANWTLTVTGDTNNQDSESIMMHDTVSGFVALSSTDTILKGLVYTWKDFNAKDLAGGSLSIHGGIVAYGGDPSSQDPGDNGHGKISIKNGKTVTFTYDPDYMKLIFDLSSGVPTRRIMQNAY